MIEIGEEVIATTREYRIDDTSEAYSEIRDLLNSKMSFGSVHEEKYYNDIDTGTIRSKIETEEVYDKYFVEEMEILLTITDESVKVELEAELVAKYTTDGWRDNVIYYGYIALFHEFIGLKNSHDYEHAIEGKVEELFERLDNILE